MSNERKIDMVILGLLSHEPRTGYDIKKRIDSSIRFFWKGSFGSIYPALTAMEKEGYVTKQDMNQGRRDRIEYSITAQGREYLKNWLESKGAKNEVKFETLLKLFFGSPAGDENALRVIEEFEKTTMEELALFRIYESNLLKVLDEADHTYYYLTVLFGIETHESYLRWCSMAKEVLKKRKQEENEL